MFRLKILVVASVLVAGLLAGCSGDGNGEDRPGVEIIGGGEFTGSVSASAAGVQGLPSAGGSGSGYQPVSNVDVYLAIGKDLADLRTLMAPASEGRAVEWPAVTVIYENGKNQVNAAGTTRSLASLPNDAVQAVFPNGAAAYGRTNFIDLMIRDGLGGSGRAQGLSDDARRHIVDKGVLMLIYGKALQEMEAARTRVAAGNLDPNSGAPHAVDEAWGAIVGAPDANSNRSYGLLATAITREGNFSLQGKLRDPLEAALVAAQAAATRGDLEAFNKANDDLRAHLNAVFYLGALRYAKVLEADTTQAQRQGHLAEGWGFYQTIRAVVASASPAAAQTVEAAYTRDAGQPFQPALTTQVYAALNEPAVLQALGIPAALVVRTPPAQ